MKRKDYHKPTMQVVELRQRTMLLHASDPVGSKSVIEDWNDGGTTNDEIYM